jgi:hypothetical protein
LMLLLGNLLSSYVYQFAVLLEAMFQVITLTLLVRWDRATRPSMVGWRCRRYGRSESRRPAPALTASAAVRPRVSEWRQGLLSSVAREHDGLHPH